MNAKRHLPLETFVVSFFLFRNYSDDAIAMLDATDIIIGIIKSIQLFNLNIFITVMFYTNYSYSIIEKYTNYS